jgi:hypothetical protein
VKPFSYYILDKFKIYKTIRKVLHTLHTLTPPNFYFSQTQNENGDQYKADEAYSALYFVASFVLQEHNKKIASACNYMRNRHA